MWLRDMLGKGWISSVKQQHDDQCFHCLPFRPLDCMVTVSLEMLTRRKRILVAS